MTSARAAGLAVIANLAPCNHLRVEPVELLLTGEIVAAICAECLLELPTERVESEVGISGATAANDAAARPCRTWEDS